VLQSRSFPLCYGLYPFHTYARMLAPRGIRTVCVRTVSVDFRRDPQPNFESDFMFHVYAADKVSPYWLRTLSVYCLRRHSYSVHGLRTLSADQITVRIFDESVYRVRIRYGNTCVGSRLTQRVRRRWRCRRIGSTDGVRRVRIESTDRWISVHHFLSVRGPTRCIAVP